VTLPPRSLLIERAGGDRPPFSAPTGALAGLLVALASTPALAQAERWEDIVPSAAPGAPFVTQLRNGRWQVRCAPAGINAPVRAEWFGAAPNDQNDDRVAIQTAIDCFNRVDLQSGTYLIQRGLAATYLDEHGVRQSLAWYRGVIVRTGTSITGTGRTNTTIKLADQQDFGPNFNLGGAQFAVVGSVPIPESASRVVVRDLSIDCNFDGQRMNPSTTPSIAALDVTGPSLLAENLKVINYGGNGQKEAFVIYSRLAFKDASAERTCATIRNVELTSPGHNLILKQAAGYPANFAEITHVAAGGAQNYDNGSSEDSRWLTHRLPVPTYTANSVIDMVMAPPGKPTDKHGYYVTIQAPEAQVFVWSRSSALPPDNVRVFAPTGPSTFEVRAAGPLGVKPGRFIRTSSLVSNRSSTAYPYSVGSEADLLTAFPNPETLPDNTQILVRNPVPATFFRPNAPRPAALSSYTGANQLESFTPWHRLGAGVSAQCNTSAGCTTQACTGSSCDPSYDPRFMGENESNRWPCWGGEISYVYIHDVNANPDGRDNRGTPRAVSPLDLRNHNASFLNGITVFESENFTITNNTIRSFDGVAIFLMSWWNKSLTITRNTLDSVEIGVQLAAITQGSNSNPSRYGVDCALQAPRFVDVRVTDNVITTSHTFTRSAAGRARQAFSIAPMVIDPAPGGSGQPCWNEPPRTSPRHDGITVTNNLIYGERYRTFDAPTILQNPTGLFVTGQGPIRKLSYTDNTSRLEFRSFGLFGMPTCTNCVTNQDILWFPGYFYGPNANLPYFTPVHDAVIKRNLNYQRVGTPPTPSLPILVGWSWNFIGFGQLSP
jgi:hypothetical protein